MADGKDNNGYSDFDISEIFTDLPTHSDKNEIKDEGKQKFVVHIDDSIDGSFEYDFAAFSSPADREKEIQRREESRASFRQFEDFSSFDAVTQESDADNAEQKSARKKVPYTPLTNKTERSDRHGDGINKAVQPVQRGLDGGKNNINTANEPSRKTVERQGNTNQPQAKLQGDNVQSGDEEQNAEKKAVRLNTRSKLGAFNGFAGFIAITLVLTLILTSVGLSTIGDIVAYNRNEKSVTVVIENEKNGDSPTLEHVIDALHSAGLIKQKLLCKFFAKFRHYDGYTDSVTGGWVPVEYLSGVYYLEPELGIEGMLNAIKKSKSTGADTVTLVFPEGWTISQIFERLEKNGVCEQSKLYANIETVAKQYDFYYNINQSTLRYLGVEGYLFPDTYEFFKNENAVSVLKKLFDNADAKWKKSYAKKAAALGYTRDEILIIASIIQREAANSSQMGDVSSVIHNRLKSSTYPSLQCNSTLDYVTNSVKSHVDASLAELYSNAYNTYRIEGLPPGPICNPGKDAIEAALNPNDTNYYFFVHNNNGKIYLSESYQQFQKDCVQVAKDNA